MHKKIKPNFFIVGAPRCGTTSLYQWLKTHPDVFMPDKKEPKYFCKDLLEQAIKNNSDHLFPIKDKEKYLDLFSSAEDESDIGEASTYYLYSKTAPKLIKDFNPEAKIIIMLRDPVEQIISSYNYSVQKGHESAKNLEEALKLEEQRKENPPQDRMPKSYLYTEKANFNKYIKRYKKHFNKNQIKIIFLKEIKNKPQKVYNDVLTFLGIVETDYSPNFNQENAGGSPRFYWVNKVLKHPSSPIRKFAELIPKSWAKQIRDVLNKILLNKDKSGVQNDVRKRLRKEFKPKVQELSKHTDKDLVKFWGYDKIN